MKPLQAGIRLARPGSDGGCLLDLDIDTGGHAITAVLGRSGAGKTTLLRCIAGLEAAVEGQISFGDETWWDSSAGLRVPCHRRRIGYVFEQGRLFPHLDVAGNLRATGSGRNPPDAEFRNSVLETLGIGKLLTRGVDALSAGERQRVAIARALLSDAELVLMDEPLSALDHLTRESVMTCLESLHRDLRAPVVYVSHSVEEVARLADAVVVLEGGRVVERGLAREVFADPGSFVARLDNPGAIIECVVAASDEDYALSGLAFAGEPDAPRLWVERIGAGSGQAVRLRIHARDVSVTLRRPTETSILNVFPATVQTLREAGPASVLVGLEVAGQVLLARVTRRSAAELGLRSGLEVYAQVKSVSLTRGQGGDD